jgi:spore coat polysaccharide biosynthesis protein SpsF
MKVGAIIQARTTSTRLPRKVLKELPRGSGITVLEQVLRRVKRSKMIDTVIVATTTGPEDDPIVEVAGKEGVGVFRGSRDDVLSRYYLAAKENGLDTVVRVTSDCPCIDPGVLDLVAEAHVKHGADYTSNTLTRTYPRGLDVEAMSFSALETAHERAELESDREHVTSYIYKTRPDLFSKRQVTAPGGVDASAIRATLDTEEDYELLSAVFDRLYAANEFFGAREIIDLFDKEPRVRSINDKVVQKSIQEQKKEDRP